MKKLIHFNFTYLYTNKTFIRADCKIFPKLLGKVIFKTMIQTQINYINY